jgi:hypothetical protein
MLSTINIRTYADTAAPLSSAPAGLRLVARYGNFGDVVAINAVVDGLPASGPRATLSIFYRDRCIAWAAFPAATDRSAVIAAVLQHAPDLLGNRCPDTANHPLSFE